MEVLSPSCFLSNMSWPGGQWNPAENKAFENALALFDENTPDRWHKVASMVPTKTVLDVIRQYKELEDDVTSIEAGLVPIPSYSSAAAAATSSPYFALDWGGPRCSYRHYYDGGRGFKHSSFARKSSARMPIEQERKKGVPWTEEEHKLFLMGLKKYGKGDWRNISRNFVITRTPTQVASHAQKYFIRQLSGGKDKRRASIHDITTVSLDENRSSFYPDDRKPLSAIGFETSKATTSYKGMFGHGRNVFATHGFTSPYMSGSQVNVFQVNAEGFHYLDA